MRQFIFICIIVLLSGKGTAQSLTDCTFSTCSFRTDELTGLAGEASAIGLSGDAVALSPGFIEVLLAIAEELPSTPPDEEPDEDEPEEPDEEKPDEEIPGDTPTSVTSVEESVSVSVAGNLLHIKCSCESRLAVYTMTGQPVVLREVVGDTDIPLPSSGLYIILLQNPSIHKVYKVESR